MKVNLQTALVALILAGIALAAHQWGGDMLSQVTVVAAIALAAVLKQLVEKTPDAP